MKYLPLLLLAPLCADVMAQANTVVGLDGRLTQVDQLTYWGRRGAAHPNGEIGMAMLNEMCNPGSVEINWQAAMAPDHPKFGFLIVRESGGRMVQINNWSFVKHAFVSTNYSASCGVCNPGTSGGSRMGLRCADTYAPSNNGDPYWLGPPQEIDPWLGSWLPTGSYFDRGDPDVGPPLNNDGSRSLSQGQVNAFDMVKNRVTVREPELMVTGSFFYGIHLIHQGESLTNRGDNLASRGFTPVYSGGQWSLGNNGVNQVYGSILQHWQGATLSSASNGTDDGRFFVAVKTTSLGGGIHHFEYAVHNADNSRGGATFRIPVPASATVSNFTFRDIDTNALNEWTSARQGNELVFTAPASNPINWNTIYNFGFDSNAVPGSGTVMLDEARLGPGALTVSVQNSIVPGGIPLASATVVGTGCGGAPCANRAFYEQFTNGGLFDLDNSGLTMTLSGTNYQVGNGQGTFINVTGASQNLQLGDDANVQVTLPFTMPVLGGNTNTLWVCSNGFVNTTNNGNSYQPTTGALLTGAYGWYPVWTDLDPSPTGGGGVFFDSTPSMARVTWNNVFQFGTTFPCTFQMQFFPNGNVNFVWRIVAAGSPTIVGWSGGGGATDPGQRDITATRNAGWTVCHGGTPHLQLDASARPLLGTTLNLVTTNIPAGTPFGAVVLSTAQANPPIDLTSQGMPGCFGHVVGGTTVLFVTPGASNTLPVPVPNNAAFLGMSVVNQSFTYSPPRTPLGVIASNAVVLLVGQV